MAKNVTVRLDDDLVKRLERIRDGMQANPTQRTRCRGEVTFSDACREVLLAGLPKMTTDYPVPPKQEQKPEPEPVPAGAARDEARDFATEEALDQ